MKRAPFAEVSQLATALYMAYLERMPTMSSFYAATSDEVAQREASFAWHQEALRDALQQRGWTLDEYSAECDAEAARFYQQLQALPVELTLPGMIIHVDGDPDDA